MVNSQSAGAQSSAFDAKPSASKRIASIDILRALTMVLMIFVNDLGSLINIPGWLGHVAAGVDGIGLADVVFPAFLFIVGLSLPYAIDARRTKGASDRDLVKHILTRTFALLVMGVFLVNGETINGEATGLSRHAWYTLSCLSFILIWNVHQPVTGTKILYHRQSVGSYYSYHPVFYLQGRGRRKSYTFFSTMVGDFRADRIGVPGKFTHPDFFKK